MRGTPLLKVATASVLELIVTVSADTPLYYAAGVKPENPWKFVPVKVIVVAED